MVLSGVGTLFTQGIDHTAYIADSLAQDDSIWSICSWHKNQNAMQVGGKGNGWAGVPMKHVVKVALSSPPPMNIPTSAPGP